MRFHRLRFTAISCAALLALSSTPSTADIQINGFLNTIGGYAKGRDHLGYEADKVVFAPDTVLGLQVSTEIYSQVSATAQLVAHGRDDFAPELAWAYMTYRLTDSAQFRMGRFRTPFFLYSDHLDVGYAQHWIAPPREVYNLQFDSVNGVDLTHQMSMGRLDATVQLYFGSADDQFTLTRTGEQLDLELREQMGVVMTLQHHWLTARASFHQVSRLSARNFQELSLPEPLGNVAGLRQAVSALGEYEHLAESTAFIVRHLDIQDVSAEFSEVAARAQWDHFFVLAEGSLLTFSKGPLADQRRHLVSAGIRTADTTFYGSYARANDRPMDLTSSLPIIEGVTTQLRQVLHGLTRTLMLEAETYSLGIRQDLDPGVAFKAEVSECQSGGKRDHLLRLGFQVVF